MADETSNVNGVDIFDTVAAAQNAAIMEVRAPATGEIVYFKDKEGRPERPWTITLYGKDHPAFIALAQKQQDRRISMNMRTRAPIPTAIIQKDDIELLVLLTKTWDVGFPGLEEPTEKNFRAAYAKYPKLRTQVDEFSGLDANFFRGA